MYAFINNPRTNFSHLIQRVPDKGEQDKFANQWSQHYAQAIKNAGPEARFEWNVRVYRSLKEVFTATCFYQESLIAKEARSWSAFYFLSYYSLFHALMASVVLIPTESIENLSSITHTKLIKLFKATFCDPKPHIIRGDIDEVFYMFKYLREYYSYNMPTNDFLYGDEKNIKPDQTLPYCIRSCGQLASLLSEIIVRSFSKNGKDIDNTEDYRETTTAWFQMLHCPQHPKSGEYIIHFSDQNRLEETIKYPQPVSFVTEFEHFTDEFRLYEGAELPRYANGDVINPVSFVYKMLIK